jgi:hypothetical protein
MGSWPILNFESIRIKGQACTGACTGAEIILARRLIHNTLYNPFMKFGRIKRQHGRVGGLDQILDKIIKNCPHVSRIVPGRIKVRRGKTPPSFKMQYPTPAGLKCLYTGTGTVQEVFLICSDELKARQWLESTMGVSPMD